MLDYGSKSNFHLIKFNTDLQLSIKRVSNLQLQLVVTKTWNHPKPPKLRRKIVPVVSGRTRTKFVPFIVSRCYTRRYTYMLHNARVSWFTVSSEVFEPFIPYQHLLQSQLQWNSFENICTTVIPDETYTGNESFFVP